MSKITGVCVGEKKVSHSRICVLFLYRRNIAAKFLGGFVCLFLKIVMMILNSQSL